MPSKHFTQDHLSMLIKYLGISLVTGAVSHGFFSGTRSISFAVVGIIFFVIGSFMEQRDQKFSLKILILSSLLAICIGSFTGGVQHFPDSPDRSLLIIPIGFTLSLVLYWMLNAYSWKKKDTLYSVAASFIVLASSIGFYLAMPLIPMFKGYEGHDHSTHQSEDHDSCSGSGMDHDSCGNMESMDHSTMDHSTMDHSAMNNVKTETDTHDHFETDGENFPQVKPSQKVTLQDGDTFDLTAQVVSQKVGNRTIKRLAYNGQIPGPLLEVDQNATITVNFHNEMEIPTTLHSHGLRLDNQFDGVPDDMGGAQSPILPGETFTYQLTFPDAGVYWYHPHIREDYTQEMGLYGNFSVVPEEDNYWQKVDQEQFLILDDFSENDNFEKTKVTKTLMGRFGNLFFINNQQDFEMKTEQGKTVRFFVTNTANTRTFDFNIQNQNLRIVGGDLGRIEQEFNTDSFVLAPAERMIFETSFEEPGEYSIRHKEKIIGKIIVSPSDQISTKTDLRKNLSDYANIRKNIDQYLGQPSDKSLTLSIQMKGMGAMNHAAMGHSEPAPEMDHSTMDHAAMGHSEEAPEVDHSTMDHGSMEDMHHSAIEESEPPQNATSDGIEWEDDMAAMNAMSDDSMIEWQIIDNETSLTNMEIDWKFKQNDLVKIRVFNDPNSVHPMQHPLHFHGQRFVVIAQDGTVNDNLQWKDTVLIPTGQTLDLLVDMSNPGTWMSHCHIAEHMHAGMMFNFIVE